MLLSRDVVDHIVTLCRIALSEEEIDFMRTDLSHILDQFEILREIDTGDVNPTTSPLSINTVMREDNVLPCLDKEQVLINAPRRQGDLFRVKAVLQE